MGSNSLSAIFSERCLCRMLRAPFARVLRWSSPSIENAMQRRTLQWPNWERRCPTVATYEQRGCPLVRWVISAYGSVSKERGQADARQ